MGDAFLIHYVECWILNVEWNKTKEHKYNRFANFSAFFLLLVLQSGNTYFFVVNYRLTRRKMQQYADKDYGSGCYWAEFKDGLAVPWWDFSITNFTRLTPVPGCLNSEMFLGRTDGGVTSLINYSVSIDRRVHFPSWRFYLMRCFGENETLRGRNNQSSNMLLKNMREQNYLIP